MHVALLCEYSSLNGGEHSILAVLPILQKHGVRVFAPPQGAFAEAIAALEIELVPFSVTDYPSLAGRRERLAELLRQHRPTLLHANSLSMGRLAGPVAATLQLPSIAHLRDIIRLNGTVIADLNRHRNLLAVSDATRSFHVTQGIDADRCTVLYNGVDLQRFRPDVPTGFLHRELGIPLDAPLLGVIGQLGIRKGQDFLLDALQPVFVERSDVHLVVVGQRWSEKDESVRYEQRLRTVAATEPYRGRVHFLGVRHDITELLREWTILVHPARQEPLGRVLLEAAASGLAVAASNVGGTAEIFGDDSARLFDADDAAALRNAVTQLLDSAELRHLLGIAARKRCENLFSAEYCAERLLAIYAG